MKRAKKFLPIMITLAVIAFAYSFFHIDGREIKFIDELLEAKTVTVIVANEENEEMNEYDLSSEQIENFQKLITNSSYTRRIFSTITGILPDKRYMIFANWSDVGQRHLQISLLGGEYIQILGEYGSHYHKIENDDFENELMSILEDN